MASGVDEVGPAPLVAAFWALVRGAGSGATAAALAAAARACHREAARLAGGPGRLRLEQRDGALLAAGVRVRPGRGLLAASAGLVAVLQRAGLEAVTITPETTVDELVALARALGVSGQ